MPPSVEFNADHTALGASLAVRAQFSFFKGCGVSYTVVCKVNLAVISVKLDVREAEVASANAGYSAEILI